MRYIRAIRRIEKYPAMVGTVGLLASVFFAVTQLSSPSILLVLPLALFWVCAVVILQAWNYRIEYRRRYRQWEREMETWRKTGY